MTPADRVAAWADEAEGPPPMPASSNRFDLPGFFQRHGQLQVRREKSLPDGTTLYELQTCPFNAEHKKGSAFITQAADGKLGFKCHHNSCSGKDWKELRGLLDPDYQSRVRAHGPSGPPPQRPSADGTGKGGPPPVATAHGAGASARAAQADESPVSGQAVPDAREYSADLAQMVADVERFIRQYVVLPAAAYLALAIWIIATHAAQCFECFAYIALLSPAKRCGKTRLLEVMEALAYQPWRGTSPTPAALYRMMGGSPTLLVDEVEALNGKNKSETAQAILAILNAGHR